MKTTIENKPAVAELTEQQEALRVAKDYAHYIRDLWNNAADLSEEERVEREINGEPCDIYDYIEQALDVEFTLDSRKNLIGVTLYVALGGPTVWIDTRREEVRCHWGFGDAWSGLDSDLCEAIAQYYEDAMEF